MTYRISGKTMSLACARYDINEAPVPDFSDLPLKDYFFDLRHKSSAANPGAQKALRIPYQVTRGCTQHCSFCSYHLVTPRIEFKNPEKVALELSEMKIIHHDPTFFLCESRINNSRVYLEALCDKLISSKADIRWTTPIGASNVDRDLLRKMRQAGCITLAWGIESGSDRILRLMGKAHTADTAANIIRISHEEGINNTVNFLIGFPGETEEDLERTISFIINNAPHIWMPCVFNFMLLPKTPVSSDPARFGIENLANAACNTELRYDEIGGNTWPEILKKRKVDYNKVLQRISPTYENRRSDGRKAL